MIINIFKQKQNKPISNIFTKKPKGYDHLVIPETNSLVDYLDLAEDVAYCPPELLRGLLYNFLRQKRIKIYKYDEVDKWLVKKAKESEVVNWYWRPLRIKDKLEKNNSLSCEVYDKLIPLHALEKLKLIENEFGNQVSFYVSDYTSDVPDPFIMVVPKNINTNVDVKDYIIIFDMWDEPGFGK